MPLPNFQPTLEGETVILRLLSAEDWAEMFAAASDPLIWELHPAKDRYKEPAFRSYFDGAIASKMAFAITDRLSGKIIGSSRYHGYDAALGEVEVGWTFIVRAYWGGTTNAEVKRLMLGYAFTFVPTVTFWVGEKNWRSQRAMEKIGGVRRDGFYSRAISGVENKQVVFEIKKGNSKLGL